MKLLRFSTALAISVASALVLAGCSTDEPDSGTNPNVDTGVAPFDGGMTDNGNPADTGGPTDTGADTGVRPDVGPGDADVGPADIGTPCPVGTEGCTCTSTAAVGPNGETSLPFNRSDCNTGLLCVPWDVISGRNFDTSPDNDLTGAVQSCLKPCNVDNDCGPGRACQDSFFTEESGIKRYCVNSRAEYGQFCGLNKLTISRLVGVTKETDDLIGCPVGTNCQVSQFSDVHPDEGICMEFCTEREPTCPVDAPLCNPRIFSSTSTVDPFVGVCGTNRLGFGSLCGTGDPSKIGLIATCDTSQQTCGADKTKCPICITGLDTAINAPAGTGICLSRCGPALSCLDTEPGLTTTCLPGFLMGTPDGVCNIDCSSFPENCPGDGFFGAGQQCDEIAFQSGDVLDFCTDHRPTALAPAHPNNAGMIPNGSEGDDCLADIDGFSASKCPRGAFCVDIGGPGSCVFGCTTSTATPNGGDTFCDATLTGSGCVDMVVDMMMPELGVCGGP